MTTEERNKWILENNEEIIQIISRYCDRYPRLEYEALYSDIIVYLIDYLDKKGEPSNDLSCFWGNDIHKVVNAKNEYETPVDFFEIVFLEDFDFESSAIVKALITKSRIGTDEYALNLVKDIAVDGYTYDEAAKKYGKGMWRIREDYLDAISALRLAAIKMKYSL